jgi:hypothetical protein
MKKVFALCICMVFFKLPCFAQMDSVSGASLKIFVSGSLCIVTGWKPTEGKLYSEDWYDDSEVNNRSVGMGFGGYVSKRIYRSMYVSAGVSNLRLQYDEFRTTPAPDPRYYPILYDSSFVSYRINSLLVPLCVHLPLLTSRTFISARLGIVAAFTTSETYSKRINEVTNGVQDNFLTPIENSAARYTGLMVNAGCDVEFRNTKGRVLLLLGTDYLSPYVSNASANKYFLKHGSVLSMRLGIGYFFGWKTKKRGPEVT